MPFSIENATASPDSVKRSEFSEQQMDQLHAMRIFVQNNRWPLRSATFWFTDVPRVTIHLENGDVVVLAGICDSEAKIQGFRVESINNVMPRGMSAMSPPFSAYEMYVRNR